MIRWIIIALLSLYICGTAAEPSAELLERANEYFTQRDWPKAIEAFEQIVAENPESGFYWSRLAVAKLFSKDYAGAEAAYLKADEFGFAPGVTRYNLTCALAMQGKVDEGFEWLEKAINSGFSQAGALDNDTDLANLRADARWATFRERMDSKVHPCMHSEEHRQLDFWIGDWNVFFVANGAQAGTNSIHMAEDGCVIQEHWSSAYGSTGSSLNFFDPETGKWTQLWTSSNGAVTHYSGELKDGAMVYEGIKYSTDNDPLSTRMTLAPQGDGSVRQTIEQSYDDGATWTVWFDAIYKPRPEEG